MHDLVIRIGTIIDGTGKPARLGDVVIDGACISAVGINLMSARREIDATDLLVLPGWVDVQTHYDGQATWYPYLTPSSCHGVTTTVFGNCGLVLQRIGPEARVISLTSCRVRQPNKNALNRRTAMGERGKPTDFGRPANS